MKLPSLYNIFFFTVILLFCLRSVSAQTDSLRIDKPLLYDANRVVHDTMPVKKHNPKLATIMSATVPGLGQIYNKKLWYVRVPLIYGSGGYFFYTFRKNRKYFKLFKETIEIMEQDSISLVNINGSEYGLPYDQENQSIDDLIQHQEEKRRNRDLSFIALTAIYVLNILDASVEAYFFDYDVSNDLSIHIEPVIFENQSASSIPGIKLNVYF